MIVVAGTTYRTGTTLVQRLINTSEEHLIYGEDNNIIPLLYTYIERMQRSLQRSNDQWEAFTKDKNTFTASMLPLHKIKPVCQMMVHTLYNEGGFKALSLNLAHVSVFKQIVPDLKVVLMYRNVNSSWKSYEDIYGWVSREEFFSYFNNSRTLLKEALQSNLDYVYPLKYEEINRSKIDDLFDWLGISNRSRIDEVLSTKIREMSNFVNPMRTNNATTIEN